MSKFTPGPWVAVQRTDQAPEVTTIAWCGDWVIGLPSPGIPGGNYRDGDPSGDEEADARLIASAPTLHAEVERLRAEVARLDTDNAVLRADVASRQRETDYWRERALSVFPINQVEALRDRLRDIESNEAADRAALIQEGGPYFAPSPLEVLARDTANDLERAIRNGEHRGVRP